MFHLGKRRWCTAQHPVGDLSLLTLQRCSAQQLPSPAGAKRMETEVTGHERAVQPSACSPIFQRMQTRKEKRRKEQRICPGSQFLHEPTGSSTGPAASPRGVWGGWCAQEPWVVDTLPRACLRLANFCPRPRPQRRGGVCCHPAGLCGTSLRGQELLFPGRAPFPLSPSHSESLSVR